MSFLSDLEKVAKEVEKVAKPVIHQVEKDFPHGVAGGPLGPINLIGLHDVPSEFRHLVLRGAITVLQDIIDYLNAHEDNPPPSA